MGAACEGKFRFGWAKACARQRNRPLCTSCGHGRFCRLRDSWCRLAPSEQRSGANHKQCSHHPLRFRATSRAGTTRARRSAGGLWVGSVHCTRDGGNGRTGARRPFPLKPSEVDLLEEGQGVIDLHAIGVVTGAIARERESATARSFEPVDLVAPEETRANLCWWCPTELTSLQVGPTCPPESGVSDRETG